MQQKAAPSYTIHLSGEVLCVVAGYVGADFTPLTGSLCCDTADECKTLIPSLADKISDDDLQDLLDEMIKLMSA